MKALRRFLLRLFTTLTGRRNTDRVREEIAEHLALQTADYVRAGLSPADARRQALLKFGAIAAHTDDYRDQQGLPAIEHLMRDVRHALRQLRKAPLFTITATLSLALGLGANAAIFIVVDRLLFRDLPVAAPHELVYVTDQRILEQRSPRFSYPFYAVVRGNDVLAGVAARAGGAMNVTLDGSDARVTGELVSGNYFSVLGAGVQLGNPLTPATDRSPGAHPVAVISDNFWRRSFASDPHVLGRTLRINNHTFTIIGVAAEGFGGTDIGIATDIWIPMMMQAAVGRDLLTEPRTNWLEMIGRVKPGANREAVAAALTRDLERRASALTAQFPGRQLILVDGAKGSSPVRRELAPALGVLSALAGLALVLACVNVASLLAVRSVAREKEIAIRLAIGARRSHLARQFLTESLVLAMLGCTLALAIAPWAAYVLVAYQTNPLTLDVSLDLRVVLFAVMASMLTAIGIGYAPLISATGVTLPHAAGHVARTARPPRRLAIHHAIVAAQIALSLAMLISAALLVQSVRSVSAVDPGFRPDNLLLISVDPAAAGVAHPGVENFWRETLDAVRQVRGVGRVTIARLVPQTPGRQRHPIVDEITGEKSEIDANHVGPDYFRTLDIPVLRGRDFTDDDRFASRPVAIVNERLARMLWRDGDVIGKTLRLAGNASNALLEVVGVVRDVKYQDLRGESLPMFYRPVYQTRTLDALTLHVRVDDEPATIAGTIRREMQSRHPNLPVFGTTTLADRMHASLAQTRQAALLASAFGVLALLLSAIGVYGVSALVVSRETHNIGLRMAFGARDGDIMRLMGRRGLVLTSAGIAVGVLGSLAFTRLAGTLLYGVSARDAATFAGMSVLLAVVSLIAFSIPVRSATRLDPLTAIRAD